MAYISYSKSDGGLGGLDEVIYTVIFFILGFLVMGMTLLVYYLLRLKISMKITIIWLVISILMFAFTFMFWLI